MPDTMLGSVEDKCKNRSCSQEIYVLVENTTDISHTKNNGLGLASCFCRLKDLSWKIRSMAEYNGLYIPVRPPHTQEHITT